MRSQTYRTSTRVRILDAANQAFSDHGYHGTSIRQIVAIAGVNVAAVNYHFGGKDALYQAVLDDAFAESNVANSPPLEDLDPSLGPEARIHAYAKRRILSSARTKAFFPPRIVGWEIVSPKKGIRAMMAGHMEKIENLLGLLISPMVPPDTPAETRQMAARWFFAASLPPPPVALLLRDLANKEGAEPDLDAAAHRLADAAVTGLRAIIGGGGEQKT